MDDPHDAIRWYRRASELGDAAGMNALGAAYAGGKGVAKDETEAVNWYRKAAGLGDAGAMILLGQAYAYGSGVSKDDNEALRWFRKAADETGHPTALNLSLIHI